MKNGQAIKIIYNRRKTIDNFSSNCKENSGYGKYSKIKTRNSKNAA